MSAKTLPDAVVPAPRWASLQRAAVYKDVSVKTIRRRIASGEITGYRHGARLIRVDLNELDAMGEPIPTGGEVA